jgi:predicted dithiol-disulfide oxidoreductase (DUF899 family)
VTRDEWISSHRRHLVKEKELTRMRDRLSAERRDLPWFKVEKAYLFDDPRGIRGKTTLSDLFAERSQLIVKHFMFGPGWGEGCLGCSFEVDHIGGALVHLEHHDVTYVAVSRAPLDEIEGFKRRMGWTFPWVSSYGSDFNYDFWVSFGTEQVAKGEVFYNYETRALESEELSGISVFYKDSGGDVFHTFSAYGRGAEELLGTYMCLDLTPRGRNENGPGYDLTDWVRHHDKYGDAETSSGCCGSATEPS